MATFKRRCAASVRLLDESSGINLRQTFDRPGYFGTITSGQTGRLDWNMLIPKYDTTIELARNLRGYKNMMLPFRTQNKRSISAVSPSSGCTAAVYLLIQCIVPKTTVVLTTAKCGWEWAAGTGHNATYLVATKAALSQNCCARNATRQWTQQCIQKVRVRLYNVHHSHCKQRSR